MLVVEDHALMRSLVADAFGQRGFEVTASPSAVEALRVADEADPDLLVTDIDLGSRPNGVELATILRERAPHIAVLFLSNVSREAAAAQAKDTVAGASFVNKGAIASVDELVARHGGGVKFAFGSRHQLEISMTVLAPDQRRTIARTDRLPYVRRDIADRKPHAAMVRPVGLRRVENQHIVQRCLAWLQHHIHGIVVIYIDGDFLAAAEHVGFIRRLAVFHLLMVAAWYDAHAAALRVAGREREPGSQHIGGGKAPVGGVLVPGNEARIISILDEELRPPAQNVRTHDVFNGVENAGMTHEFIDPGQQQVRLGVRAGGETAAFASFERFEFAQFLGSLLG